MFRLGVIKMFLVADCELKRARGRVFEPVLAPPLRSEYVRSSFLGGSGGVKHLFNEPALQNWFQLFLQILG